MVSEKRSEAASMMSTVMKITVPVMVLSARILLSTPFMSSKNVTLIPRFSMR